MKNINWHLNKEWIRMKVYAKPNDPCVYYINERVNPNDWSRKKQRVLSSNNESYAINELIDAVETFVKSTLRKYKIKGMHISSDILRRELHGRFSQNKLNTDVSFFEYVESWYGIVKSRVAESSLKSYKSRVSMLKNNFPNFNWNDICWSWRNRSYHHLIEVGYEHNTISKMYGVIRTINNDAVADGVSNIKSYPKRWMPSYIDSGAIFMPGEDVNTLLDHNYSSVRLSNAVLNWKIQYLTACRYIEIERVVHGQIIHTKDKSIIRWKQAKGNNNVSVVMGESLRELINNPPKLISNVKLNKYIKEAAKEAGISYYDKITTHTARRSCATNMALQGYPISLISNMLGHSSEKETKKYIRYSDIESAIKVSNHSSYSAMFSVG